jgi:hypothetical protein
MDDDNTMSKMEMGGRLRQRQRSVLNQLQFEPSAFLPPGARKPPNGTLSVLSEDSSESDGDSMSTSMGRQTSTVVPTTRRSCWGCFRRGKWRSAVTRKSSLRKQLQPLIDHPDNTLTPLQREWLHSMFMPMAERTVGRCGDILRH